MLLAILAVELAVLDGTDKIKAVTDLAEGFFVHRSVLLIMIFDGLSSVIERFVDSCEAIMLDCYTGMLCPVESFATFFYLHI